MKEILRRTWAEIDLDALARDFAAVRQAANKNAKVCCVIKADAYGHGAVRMAQEFEALGADWFAVSNLEEALQLRLGGISRPMLVLGYTPPEEAATLAKHRISQCVYSLIHVKIDTGMSRLGFYFQDISRDEATVQEVKAACTLPGLYPEGIFTHFAVSDEGQAGDAFTMRQFGCFKEMIESLLREGISFAVRHCANSAAVFDYPLSHLDMVRAGIVIYGLYPSAALRNRPQLTPVLALKSVVSHVKEVKPGATISYGRKFTAGQAMKVATIPVGYADGYPRILSAQGAQVLIGGKRCPILGRICMDQLMAEAGTAPRKSPPTSWPPWRAASTTRWSAASPSGCPGSTLKTARWTVSTTPFWVKKPGKQPLDGWKRISLAAGKPLLSWFLSEKEDVR